MKNATFTGTTHTCPICGEKGPCINLNMSAGQVRFHNCNLCGSTWRDSDVRESIEDTVRSEDTAGLVSLL